MKDIVIIGSGPAGIFAAYTLATSSSSNDLHITVIDRGKSILDRKCPMRSNTNKSCVNCKPCNIMNGFGGAGAFSDCKLSLTPYGVGGDICNYIEGKRAEDLINRVEKTFSVFDKNKDSRKVVGSKDDEKVRNIIEKCKNANIDFTLCPTKHLGTDGTYDVMVNMFTFLTEHNVNFLFNTEVITISKISYNDQYAIYTKNTTITADYIIMAPGRSGDIWLKNLAENLGINTNRRKIDIGVRVETKAKNVKSLTDALYDMKFSYTDDNGIKTRTFCTNPGGYVSEEHYDNGLAVVNGHSFADHKSENTNFAILVTLDETSEYLHNFVELNNKISGNKIICQNFVDFVNNLTFDYSCNSSVSNIIPTLKTAVFGDLTKILPGTVCMHIYNFINALSNITDEKINTNETLLYGIEAKFYSDIIEVDNNLQTKLHGLYIAGDAGISRGITQAASCGIVVAENILNEVFA